MMIIDDLASTWARLGWPLLVSLTVATVVVAALRRLCRVLFGAERACQLWLLPVVAVLADPLPHPVTVLPALPAVVLRVASAAGVLPTAGPLQTTWFRTADFFALWLIGFACVGIHAWRAQRRYRRGLEGAQRVLEPSLRWPVWRSLDHGFGPATVGAWQPCIVVPADFESRYEPTERELILAHEAAHARRGDGCWMLCAQVMVAACWFHPLAWWALGALRHDQELACDAAVLRERRGVRRAYAQAMLKTQPAALALPVGCSWLSRHPVTERIAMLNQRQPSLVRRRIGAFLLAGAATVLAGAVYAANQPPAAQVNADKAERLDRHTLKLALGLGGQPTRLHVTACLRPGQFYETTQGGIEPLPPWHARFTVVPAGHGLLEVQGEISGGVLDRTAYPKISMRPGQQGTIEVGEYRHGADGAVTSDHTLKMDLTPFIGC